MKKVFWYLLERKIIHYLSTNRSVLTQEVRVFVSKYWFLELDSCFKIFSFSFLKIRLSNFEISKLFSKFRKKKFKKLTALPHVKSSVFPLTVIALTVIVFCKIFTKIIIHHHEETVIFVFSKFTFFQISSLSSSLLFFIFFE